MTKLILIEGIPGSGKTTFALRLEKHLNKKGIKARCLLEGDPHPADLAWCGVLSAGDYDLLLSDFPEYKDQIESVVIRENGSFIVPYLDLKPRSNDLIAFLEKREPFDGKLASEDFLSLNLERWSAFSSRAADGDGTYIFECAYLQNHINEMLLYHEPDYEYILGYFNRLYSVFNELNPVMVYLDQTDIDETIGRAAKERISPDETAPDWIDRVVEYITASPYGISHGLSGYDGTVQYFRDRVEYEHKLLEDLPIKTLVIKNDGYHWDDMFGRMVDFVESHA